MATITLGYNTGNELIKSILNSAILAGAYVLEENKTVTKHLTPFEEALEDIKHRRVTKVKNVDNVIEEILQ
jgi:hypothetical protein